MMEVISLYLIPEEKSSDIPDLFYGKFDHPCGMTVDCEGNILIADSYDHCIQKFTPEGQFLKSIGSY